MKSYKSSFITKIVLLVVCFIILGLGVSSIVYSEYIKSTRGKRVVAPHDSTTVLFSSNYLSPASDNSTNRRILYVKTVSDKATADITICNYAQGNAGTYNSNNLNYNLTVTLGTFSNGTFTTASSAQVGDLSITLTFNRDTEHKVTLNSSNLTNTITSMLLANTDSTDHLLVEYNTEFNTNNPNNICAKVEAVLNPAIPGLPNLNAIFSTALVGEAVDSGWSAYFDEPGASGVVGAKNPNELDGFNCTISGVGEGTFRFYWDSSALVINEIFLSEISATVYEGSGAYAGYNYIEIEVNSNNRSRYDFQLYRNEGTTDSFSSWVIVKDYIKFVYTPSE
ncbi:MAG: hypothetical protein J6W64_07455 [Bacilli bacterium]|nr:hypothetical protein [Bacilli bacterium]